MHKFCFSCTSSGHTAHISKPELNGKSVSFELAHRTKLTWNNMKRAIIIYAANSSVLSRSIYLYLFEIVCTIEFRYTHNMPSDWMFRTKWFVVLSAECIRCRINSRAYMHTFMSYCVSIGIPFFCFCFRNHLKSILIDYSYCKPTN